MFNWHTLWTQLVVVAIIICGCSMVIGCKWGSSTDRVVTAIDQITVAGFWASAALAGVGAMGWMLTI